MFAPAHHPGRVANFGVRVVSQARGVKVTPRVVRGNDENRLTGYVGLPGRPQSVPRAASARPVPAAGAILPSAGTYELVFDTPSRAAAGKFTFRLWINDTTPPRVKVKRYARGVADARRRPTPAPASIPTTLAAGSTARAAPCASPRTGVDA